MSIEEKKKNRFLFLQKLYDTTDGSSAYNVNMWELGKELGFDHDNVSNIVEYLNNEDLIEYKGLGGGIGISHYGIQEIEDSHENPDSPTQHFPPINVIHVENMSNSAIQQGTNNSNQSVVFNTAKSDELKKIITEIDNIKKNLELEKLVFDELVSEIDTLKSQIKSPKPKNVIISESLKTIKNILINVATHPAIPVIIEMINKMTS